MKKAILLAIALLSNITIAADFYALTAIHTAPFPIQDEKLSTIEGGAICNFQTASSGISICDVVVSWPIVKITSNALFVANNGLTLSNGQFIQISK